METRTGPSPCTYFQGESPSTPGVIKASDRRHSGLGCGIIQSAVFIAVQASIDPLDKAAGISGFFLATQIGTVLGMAAVSALMIGGLRQTLTTRLLAQGVSRLE